MTNPIPLLCLRVYTHGIMHSGRYVRHAVALGAAVSLCFGLVGPVAGQMPQRPDAGQILRETVPETTIPQPDENRLSVPPAAGRPQRKGETDGIAVHVTRLRLTGNESIDSDALFAAIPELGDAVGSDCDLERLNGLADRITAYYRRRGYQSFLRELSAHLRSFLRKRLASLPDDVEDLVQETLLAVHNQRHTYDSGLPVSAWVQAIARYKWVDLLRRRAARDLLTEPFDEETELLTSADADAAEAHRDLNRLLDDLPDKQRLPIRHVKLEGLSVKEAATLTGMSESAIKVGVHRGLKALAAKIRGLK